jgi:hypothetical protein
LAGFEVPCFDVADVPKSKFAQSLLEDGLGYGFEVLVVVPKSKENGLCRSLGTSMLKRNWFPTSFPS